MTSRQRRFLLLAALLGAGSGLFDAAALQAAVASAADSSIANAIETPPGDDLRATTAAPWNPPAPVPAAEPWETALRLPGRIVSLPFSALGYVTEQGLIAAERSNFIPKVAAFALAPARLGLIVAPVSLGDRTGFGVITKLSLPRIRRFFTAEWDGSTLHYSRTRLEAGYGPARLEYGYDWRPQDRFFGIGLDSSPDDAADYASRSENVRFDVKPAPIGRAPWRLLFGGWLGIRSIVLLHGREDGGRSVEEVFPSLDSMLDQQFNHVVSGTSVALDGRAGAPHWTHGTRVAIEAESFGDPPAAKRLFGPAQIPSSFTRLRYEIETGFSFFPADPRTIRLAVRAEDRKLNSGTIPLPDLAVLGGQHGLAGFEPRRFHDVDMAAGKLTYIFPVGKHFEIDAHTEAGGVYGDLWSDARLSTLRHSYGVALRPRGDRSVLGQFGVDWSTETWRVRYSLGGVE